MGKNLELKCKEKLNNKRTKPVWVIFTETLKDHGAHKEALVA
jgi:hypothetical protein